MKNSSALKDILCLLGLGALIFIVNIWGYPLFDVDEPRYAETAREMLLSTGDWITPHFNWVTRFDKPAMFYWMIAGAYKLFGVSAGSARLVSAACAIAIALMLYGFIRKLFHRELALMTSLVFMTMMEVAILGRWSITDMTLTCFMAGTWLSFYKVLSDGPKWFIPAGLFAGLGLLTKGPVALALPGLTFILALVIWHRKQWRLLLSPWMFAGLALCFGIAMPWYMAIAKANPNQFVGSFFFLHNVKRFTDTVSGHTGPWYYYFPVVLLGSFPWCLFTPGLVYLLLWRKTNLPDCVNYALLWFGLVFLFFSLAGTKLLTYVLPGFPPLAIIFAWYWYTQTQDFFQDIRAKLWMNRGLWVITGVVGLFLAIALIQPYAFIAKPLASLYNPTYTALVLSLLLLILMGTAWCNSRYPATRRGFWILGLGLSLFWGIVGITVIPEACTIAQQDVVRFAKRVVTDSVSIATYKTKKPSLVFYTQQKVYYLPGVHDKTSTEAQNSNATLHNSGHPLYVVIKNKDRGELASVQSFEILETGAIYSLIKVPDFRLVEDINQ